MSKISITKIIYTMVKPKPPEHLTLSYIINNIYK